MEKLDMHLSLYRNQRIGIQLNCEDGEPWGALTCNIVDADLADDEVCIPVWNHSEELVAAYLASGQFEDTGRAVTTGYVQAPVWRVVCPDLLEEARRLRSGPGL